jgi:1-acyl-sn-glycerol-3-phosphate acyltransferase
MRSPEGATMADADVIPLGVRGRPGRGTARRTTPSTAARSLAPRSTPRRSPPRVEEAGQPGRSEGTEPLGESSPPYAEPPPQVRDTGAGTAEESGSPFDVDRLFVERSGGGEGFDLAAAIARAAQHVFGDDWEHRLAEMLAFARRRLSGDYSVDEFGFDAELTSTLTMTALRPLAERWFRIEVRGLDNIPAESGALVVSNHSGTLPIDALMTGLVVHDHAHRYLRMLGADLIFRLPFIGEIARRGGATLACGEDAERMLAKGDLVGVWPEGFKGIGKPYKERYNLQRFGRGGFVSAALRTRVPIVPCSIVGAEEIYPLIGNLPSLARLLGIPYVPITPFFPWLGPLGMIPLPSKWIIEFGEPIRTDAFTGEAAEDPMVVFNLTDQVRETIQQTLYALLVQRRNVFF